MTDTTKQHMTEDEFNKWLGMGNMNTSIMIHPNLEDPIEADTKRAYAVVRIGFVTIFPRDVATCRRIAAAFTEAADALEALEGAES